jgi:hypothetical protein
MWYCLCSFLSRVFYLIMRPSETSA